MWNCKNSYGRRSAFVLAVTWLMLIGSMPAWADTAAERLTESTTVLKEIMDTPDKGIPDDLLRSAYCLVIVPGVKNVGFVIGGKYGRGFVLCRQDNRTGWGPPAAVRIEGGSVGFQIGASETDVVMLVMDKRSMSGILSSKFTLGGGAAVAAGPVGRSTTAQTDATLQAKILSYSRSRGVFAGLALTGATLREDRDENHEMYGTALTNKAIVTGHVSPPSAAADLIAFLNSRSRREA